MLAPPKEPAYLGNLIEHQIRYVQSPLFPLTTWIMNGSLGL